MKQSHAVLSEEIDSWEETYLRTEILEHKLNTLDEIIDEQFQAILQLDNLDETIDERFKAIQWESKVYDRHIKFNLSSQLNFSDIGTSINSFAWWKILKVIQLKSQVIEQVLKDFNQMKGKLSEVFQEFVKSVFDYRVKCASKAITLAISNCEKSLEQQEQAYQANLQECEAIRATITQKRQQLEQLQKELEAIAQQIAG